MKVGFKSNHYIDAEGKPDGGSICGLGFTITWQRGPVTFLGDEPKPNGAFLEDIIDACLSTLRYYQETQFACLENSQAIAHLEVVLAILSKRSERRKSSGILGTHLSD